MNKEQEQQNTMGGPQEDVNMGNEPAGMSGEMPQQEQKPQQDGPSKLSIAIVVVIAVMVMIAATFYLNWF